MVVIKILKRLWKDRWIFRSLPYTLYFNFHYLPFRHAILLPIWLFKPKLLKCGGKLKISNSYGKLKPGMITLGKDMVSIYPSNGITWENRGTIIFGGHACIGNNSYISTGEDAVINIGEGFLATTSLKIVSYDSINIGRNCTIGWDCLIMDTDFHTITKIDNSHTKGFGPINIGNNIWIANGCKIYKNISLPDYIVVASNTILTQSHTNIPKYSVIGNKRSVDIISQGWFNKDDNKINYK